jgi:hypothetical protein
MTFQGLLDQMLRDSRIYYVPEGLPGRGDLLRTLRAQPADLWRALTPLQSFFIFETAPEYLNKAPRDVAQSAYCAALEALPGDWWGPYGNPVSETAQRLLQVDGIEACLLRQLDNEKRIDMGDSESATLSRLEKLQVADLAALFLAARHSLDYSMHRQPEERKACRVTLRTRIEGAQ